MIRCIAAYFEDMEQGSKDCPLLRAQVAASLAEYDRLAGHKVEILEREFINGLEHRLHEYRRPVEEICIEPLAAISQALPLEYAAEMRARKQFLKDHVDGVIAGGLYDDHRIYRYMHGSHSVIQHGLPGRWAGNRVFPNGFFEVKLKGGDELVVFGDVTETRKFTISINGISRKALLDSDGICKFPLDPSCAEVTVRLSKEGLTYPLFHAVVTRKKNV